MNKTIKKIFWLFILLIAVLLLANFGVNIWLKNKLPVYIKNNSNYRVSYKNLNVDITTGNISASNIRIFSKNPEKPNIFGLDGTIDSLKISRLGIWDALVNKKINSTNLQLVNPNLKITLTKSISKKVEKKRIPVAFKNIKIRNGNIEILRYTKQKFLSINNLVLNIHNLKLDEESEKNKIPLVFDDYDIKGEHFYFRPDSIYLLKADIIATINKQISVRNFQLTPLISYPEFTTLYPKKASLISFNAKEMLFNDIVLHEKKAAFSKIKLDEPELIINTAKPKFIEKNRIFDYEVNIENVSVNNAKVHILKPNGTTLLNVNQLVLNINKMKMSEETKRGSIPFSYEKFQIVTKNINYINENQNIIADYFILNPRVAEVKNLSVKPTSSSKNPSDFKVDKFILKINALNFENNKVMLNAESAMVLGLSGNINLVRNKKSNFNKKNILVKIKNILINSPRFTLNSADNSQTFNDLILKAQNFEMNEKTAMRKIPFHVEKTNITTKNFYNRVSRFYTLKAGLIKMNNNKLLVNDLSLKPVVSRSTFIKMIPVEKDLFYINVKQISATGIWDLITEKKSVFISNVLIDGMKANVFRSKIPKDDPSIKSMFSEKLRNIKIPLFINNLDIKNSLIEYEEDTKESLSSGKIFFESFNANIKNINSGKTNGKSTQIPINIHCNFMGASPLNVIWNMNTANKSDAFTISGNLTNLPANEINPFIEPYFNIKAIGDITSLSFRFQGNVTSLNGTMNMKHQNLKITLLNRSGEKKKFLTAVANVFVKTNSGKFPESVQVDNVKRNPTKSFFNFFWRGLQEGLKKTLIGKNVENTEKTIKNTVLDVKSLKKVFEEKEGNKIIQQQKNKENPKKEKGVLNNIFKKKKKNENKE